MKRFEIFLFILFGGTRNRVINNIKWAWGILLSIAIAFFFTVLLIFAFNSLPFVVQQWLVLTFLGSIIIGYLYEQVLKPASRVVRSAWRLSAKI